jgi:hypothetical protein
MVATEAIAPHFSMKTLRENEPFISGLLLVFSIALCPKFKGHHNELEMRADLAIMDLQDSGSDPSSAQEGRAIVWLQLFIMACDCLSCWLGMSTASGVLRGDDQKSEAISPRQVVLLFNGKDLSGLSTWLKDTKQSDPRGVFRVENGVLHISGDGNGYVATKKEYGDYRLVVEYKWGTRTDGGKNVRNSGILLHATGPYGGAGGTWMSSIECQLAQGCVGDLIPIRGKDAAGEIIPVRFTSEVVLGPDNRPRWKPGGPSKVFTQGQLWWFQHDPDYKELLDTRGKNDVESRLGEWTRVECVCEGDSIKIHVNGTPVNSCREAVPAAGKILLQSEGFELYVRKFELHPLDK